MRRDSARWRRASLNSSITANVVRHFSSECRCRLATYGLALRPYPRSCIFEFTSISFLVSTLKIWNDLSVTVFSNSYVKGVLKKKYTPFQWDDDAPVNEIANVHGWRRPSIL
ncbi:hypothetical protein EVAR_11651_1 [Eumeta japonica]|uniref:Uncharacterized protein n=1 Tax=Eumeta variegata TaxID=151549 RepID=A0A4C1WXR1_EUMVA|nr:hypothetical protein EVAR_11651_1 [Eumeta japonica]